MKNNVKELSNELGERIKNAYEFYTSMKEDYIDKRIIRKIGLPMSNSCENEIARMISKILNNKYNIIVDSYIPYNDVITKKNKLYRPDIIIIKTYKREGKIVNEIIAIVEVKAQMGYCGILNTKVYEDKITGLFSDEFNISNDEYERLSCNAQKFYINMGLEEIKDKKTIKYEINNNLKIFIVNLMDSNHVKNVEGTIGNFIDNKSNVNFYNLYGANSNIQNIWYNNLGYSCIYELNNVEKYVDISTKNENGSKKISYNLTQDVRKKHGFEQFINDIKNLDN